MGKPFLLSLIFATALFLVASPVAARDGGPATTAGREAAATAGNPARPMLSMSVVRQGVEATYSITLRNMK